mmetsp:Transcript_48712/g.77887  ORF Transcript_48712/g.77887 Transcript_48712/m.77887 type:complete len:152 (+) Transcript_48712:2-457(+)
MEKEITESTDDSPSALDGYMTDKISPTIHQLQVEVVNKFGFNKTAKERDEAIKILRSALSLYPNDAEIKNAANYLKYNRVNRGNFVIGHKIPKQCETMQVIKLSESPKSDKNDKNEEEKKEKADEGLYESVRFLDLLSQKEMNVVIAVSVT